MACMFASQNNVLAREKKTTYAKSKAKKTEINDASVTPFLNFVNGGSCLNSSVVYP